MMVVMTTLNIWLPSYVAFARAFADYINEFQRNSLSQKSCVPVFATCWNMFHVGCTLISIFCSSKKKEKKTATKKNTSGEKNQDASNNSVECDVLVCFAFSPFLLWWGSTWVELYLRNAETWTMKCRNWLPPNHHYEHVNENPICCLCNYLFSSLCFFFRISWYFFAFSLLSL